MLAPGYIYTGDRNQSADVFLTTSLIDFVVSVELKAHTTVACALQATNRMKVEIYAHCDIMTVTADSILVRGSCSSITTTSCPPSGRAGGPPTMTTMKRGPPMPLEALRDRLLLMRATKSPMSPLTEEECISVADQASMIFASEPILLYIEPPINIYGDTHGMSLAIRGMRNFGRKP